MSAAKVADLKALKRVYGEETLRRGEDYFDDGRVLVAVKLGRQLFGKVLGTQEYGTSVDLNTLEGMCTCPVHDDCKHAAALLLQYSKGNWTDGDRTMEELNASSKQELLKMIESVIHESPELILRVEHSMMIRSKGETSKEKGMLNPKLAESVQKKAKEMLGWLLQGGRYEGPEEFARLFPKFVRANASYISKELIFYAVEFLIKESEEYGFFYNDYADSYYGDDVFEALCDAFVSKSPDEGDLKKLKRLVEDGDDYDTLDTFLMRMVHPENAPKLVHLDGAMKDLLMDVESYAEFLINAGKKEDARRILEDKSNELDQDTRFDLYLRVDKEKAIEFARRNNYSSSLISFYHDVGSHQEAVELFRRADDKASSLPLDNILDSLRSVKPADYAELLKRLFDRSFSSEEYDLCAEIGMLLDDRGLLFRVLDVSRSEGYGMMSTEVKRKLLEHISSFDPKRAKIELEALAESLIGQKNDYSYEQAARCTLTLKKICSNREWEQYLQRLSDKHFRKTNLVRELKQKGITMIR